MVWKLLLDILASRSKNSVYLLAIESERMRLFNIELLASVLVFGFVFCFEKKATNRRPLTSKFVLIKPHHWCE